MSNDNRSDAGRRADRFSQGAHAAHRFTGKEKPDQGEQVRRELEQKQAAQDRRS